MSVQHFKSLLFKSSLIQREIEREHKRRWPDWARLLKLKKLRLAIKDHLSRVITSNRRYGALQMVKIPVGKRVFAHKSRTEF